MILIKNNWESTSSIEDSLNILGEYYNSELANILKNKEKR